MRYNLRGDSYLAPDVEIDSYLAAPQGRRARGRDPLAQLRIDAQAHAAERATALDAYTAFLSDTLHAGPDASWASGRVYYDWVLKNVHFLPYTADSIDSSSRTWFRG